MKANRQVIIANDIAMISPAMVVPDTSNPKNFAHKIANNIRSYWRDCGFVIRVWVERQDNLFDPEKAPEFTVRSELINGLPINYPVRNVR